MKVRNLRLQGIGWLLLASSAGQASPLACKSIYQASPSLFQTARREDPAFWVGVPKAKTVHYTAFPEFLDHLRPYLDQVKGGRLSRQAIVDYVRDVLNPRIQSLRQELETEFVIGEPNPYPSSKASEARTKALIEAFARPTDESIAADKTSPVFRNFLFSEKSKSQLDLHDFFIIADRCPKYLSLTNLNHLVAIAETSRFNDPQSGFDDRYIDKLNHYIEKRRAYLKGVSESEKARMALMVFDDQSFIAAQIDSRFSLDDALNWLLGRFNSQRTDEHP